MRIVVAMSGGVDSSVAAALLVEQGHEVIGVHMKLHDAPLPETGGKTCCGLDDALDARRVASQLGIPYYVLDLRQAFEAAVLTPFVDAYRRGETPSPCVACNGVLKFDVLFKRARALGADALATGHYARVDDQGGLRVAADPDKDQSYFLFPVSREALRAVRFPLGGMSKPEVRAQAARLGLATAAKPESQDVCFLPDHDHARLVAARHPEDDGAGEIVDQSGAVLGRHDGYWRYTVGQRRGLGVATGAPIYVLRVEPETRRVVVGPDAALLEQGLLARGTCWFRRPDPGETVLARIRHRGALIPASVEAEDDRMTLRFRAPARAVAPGQAVVLYQGDEVLGGGWIRRPIARDLPAQMPDRLMP